MHEPWVAVLAAVIFVFVASFFLRLILKKTPEKLGKNPPADQHRLREFREIDDERPRALFRLAKNSDNATSIMEPPYVEDLAALKPLVGSVYASLAGSLLDVSPTPSDLMPAREGHDNVECSVFAKPMFSKGKRFAIRAYLHVAEDAARVVKAAATEDPSVNRLARQSLFHEFARGAP